MGCLEDCPECFIDEEGECVPDNENIDCAHVATFHSTADLDKEPAACTALEDLQTQEAGTSLSLTEVHARLFEKEALLTVSEWRSKSHAGRRRRRKKSTTTKRGG